MDTTGRFIIGAAAIRDAAREMVTGIELDTRKVYAWSATRKLRVGRLGSLLITTPERLREDLERAAELNSI